MTQNQTQPVTVARPPRPLHGDGHVVVTYKLLDGRSFTVESADADDHVIETQDPVGSDGIVESLVAAAGDGYLTASGGSRVLPVTSPAEVRDWIEGRYGPVEHIVWEWERYDDEGQDDE